MSGYFFLEVSVLDTNAGGEYIDTTKDSLSALLYTDWGNTTYQKLIYKVANLKPTTSATTTTYFSIPTDSIIGTRLYWNFSTAISDSDNSVARDTLGVTYKATVNMIAKP